jgi:diguanylate cyclase (GGDEF)-like protein
MDLVSSRSRPEDHSATMLRRPIRSMRFPAATLALLVSVALPALAAESPPVLRTVRQAHILSNSEADHHYPILLPRALITYIIPGYAAFIQDRTDGIYVRLPSKGFEQLRPGDLVSVKGDTAPGDLVPVIENPQFRFLGHGTLPPAPLVGLDRLTTGAYDSKLVTVEGIIRAFTPIPGAVPPASPTATALPQCFVTLASGQDRVDISLSSPQGCARRDLVDAKVRLKMVAGSRFNQRKQLIGILMFMQDFSSLQVEEPPPADPYRLPLTDTAGVMRFGKRDPGHRVRVHGVVTSTWGQQQFSLMDARYGIFVHTDNPAHVRVGDMLDVVGFPTWADYTSVLDDAILRRDGAAPVPAPAVMTAAQALDGAHDAEPVQIVGQLLYKSRTPSEQDLLLTASGITFRAALPADAARGFPSDLRPGSLLRVSGICFIEVAPDKTPKALKILLQSPADVLVLSRPSWWTPRNTVLLSGLLLAIVAIVAAWNVGLRRRVRAQTRVIRSQLQEAHTLRLQAEAAHREKSQSLSSVLSLQRDLLDAQEKLRYQATHDVLTGLWNRAALLDLFRNEIERALRTHSSLGVLMLDVDHFKPVNDTLGHLAGDEVLKEIAQRIANATRGYDLSGRYGGEEFLVILPGCDREQTKAGAERIRAAIASRPFLVAGSAISLTVSIGATVAPVCARIETEILSLADLALYQAKSAGRNCTVLRTTVQEDRETTTI